LLRFELLEYRSCHPTFQAAQLLEKVDGRNAAGIPVNQWLPDRRLEACPSSPQQLCRSHAAAQPSQQHR